MFDQTIASAAIAARVKALYPETVIALGGYAARSPTAEMLLEAFPWVDAVCSGEGEPCVTALAQASNIPGHDLSGVPNLFRRDAAGKVVQNQPAPPVDMDTIPTPNYDDFYADIRRLRAESAVEVSVDRLPLENSRGCWWGAIHHCVFCGIHDDDLVYRAKSGQAVLQSLDELNIRYGSTEFRFADYILPQRYYTTLLPKLVERGTPYNIKCELKANINEKQLKLLVEAGFVEVQPGIESFSSDSLRNFDKGVSGAQNVYLLLLARRYGIVILYNILYGLPNDDPEKYEAMRRTLPRLAHLDPPASRIRIQITRFAPLQTAPRRFGIRTKLRHDVAYDLIFSESYLKRTGFDLDRYCYIFEHPFDPAPRLAHIYREIDTICDAWNEAYLDRRREVDLLYEHDGHGGLVVRDSRELPERVYRLNAAEAGVLTTAESPKNKAALKEALPESSSASLDEILARLDALGLLFQDDGKILSLALPRHGVVPRQYWWANYETRWQKVA
jgi:ribosomal peptide maturation radical SAM protein 1